MKRCNSSLRLLIAGAMLASAGLIAIPAYSAAAASISAQRAQQPASSFRTLADQFLDAYWQQDPEGALQVGYYRYADRLPVDTEQRRAERLAFADRWIKRFAQLDAAGLSAAERTDLALIDNQLKSMKWYLTDFRAFEWNPSDYNVADGFARLLTTEYAPLDKRLAAVLKRLQSVPAYYAAAKANLRTPTREHTELAIAQNEGTKAVLGAEVDAQVDKSALSAADKKLFHKRLADARAAIDDYVAYLKQLYAGMEKNGARSFRIGKDLYEKKFAHDIQADMTADELYRRAVAEKERLHARMEALADELWPKYMGGAAKPADRLDKIGQLIDKMSEHHTTPANYVPEVRRMLPQIEKWIADKDLLELDPTRPLIVRETPKYERGVSTASIEAPGPYDPKAATYYNVTPLDDLTPQQAESHLREYNDWVLQVLTIHEALPGHYVQLLHANKSPSRIKSLFGNGAMVEGWAVYSERMMMESGYGGNTPEMWLMYSKWNLRAVCNTILDYGVHVLGMSRDEALKLLMHEAFQSEAEATGKWRRVQLTSVQLTSYFAGYAEIYDFRERLKREQGDRFNLKNFHERFLSYGSAPVGMIKRLMNDKAAAADKISGEGLLRHIKALSSDRFEGRAPGTRGEKLTVAYVKEQFKKLGLLPGNPDGGFEQKVPMMVTESSPTLTIEVGGKTMPLKFPEEYVAASYITQPDVKIDRSEMVFVGYGVQAPEYGWDDFKGLDVRGKTLVMLVNDPPVPDPKDPAQLDPNMFGGRAMTYYGRWTYKYEIAAKLGAAAALIVHETKPASYPYDVVVSSFTTPRFSIYSEQGNRNNPPAPGWLHLDTARALFKAAGLDFDALKQAAVSKDFKPVSLGAAANFRIANKWKKLDTSNVIGNIEGADPALKNEYVIYTAHWDHLGIDKRLPGPRSNQIYHGAVDNASGVASILELAKAYKGLPNAPKRTILFMATTAEEKNLLGAQYYAAHPLYPLDRTLVDINIDTINTWGRTKDVEISGAGKSTTDDIVAKVAATQGRVIVPEQRPETGWFYRGDQFEFAKVGVPVVYVAGGEQYVGKAPDFAKKMAEDYTAHHYHKAADVVHKDWDLSGAVEDARLLFFVGQDIAEGSAYPQWKAGAEFKAARDTMMQGSGR
jgi:Zn-dependent M28 family amino/carboxypeptidase/uncharacterized protein (DUF885 family)